MHVLWIIPEYNSFLVEEIREVAILVDRVTVVSQSEVVEIPGVTVLTTPPATRSISSVYHRFRTFGTGLLQLPLPLNKKERKQFYSICRQSDFISSIIRSMKVDIVHSHFAYSGWLRNLKIASASSSTSPALTTCPDCPSTT